MKYKLFSGSIAKRTRRGLQFIWLGFYLGSVLEVGDGCGPVAAMSAYCRSRLTWDSVPARNV